MEPSEPTLILHGLRALIVEDDFLIAMHAETILLDLGARECVTAASSEQAEELLGDPGIGFAMLDYHLGESTCETIALRLREAGVPFVITTGYMLEQGDLPSLGDAPVIAKPYTFDQMAAAADAARSRPSLDR